jgi:outer membrane protein assembly factor BamB
MKIQVFRLLLFILVSSLIVGCYGTVQLDNDVEFFRQEQSIIPVEPSIKWQRKTRDPIQDLIPLNDSLALAWTHRGTVMILNLNDGKKDGSAWTPSMGHITSITVNRDADWFVYVSMKNRQAGAYDLRSGKQIWKNRIDHLIRDGALIITDTAVVMGTRRGLKLYNALDGELIKENQNRFGITKLFAAGRNRFLAVTDAGDLQCYDHQLSQLWAQPIGLNSEAQTVLREGRLFTGPGRDTLWVLDEKTGNIRLGLPFRNGFDFQVLENDELILVHREGRVTKMNLDGDRSWTADFGLGLPGASFIRAGEHLFVPYARGVALNVDSRTGKEIWRSEPLRRLTGFWPAGSGFLIQDIKYQMRFYQ